MAGLLLVIIAFGTLWLLLALFGGGTSADQARLEVFRATSNVVLGAGGAVALLLAARRQRLAELELRRKEQELAQRERTQDHVERVAADSRAHQVRLAEDASLDAIERRITELYTKAADQLGSTTAAVRLAGLYALERLAQNTPTQRQTIVNLLCAYLRMPYTLPSVRTLPPWSSLSITETRPDAAEAPRRRDDGSDHASTQELEVRGTAQRILADHLYPGDDPHEVRSEYWPDIKLNLTGALLCHFDLRACRIGNVRFGGARFAGWTRFENVRFDGHSIFGGATFERSANFKGARFQEVALFRGVRFHSSAAFENARFHGGALFGGERTIDGVAHLDGAVFHGSASFAGAEFAGDVDLAHARVSGENHDHVWPDGWKLSPDGDAPVERTLVFAR